MALAFLTLIVLCLFGCTKDEPVANLPNNSPAPSAEIISFDSFTSNVQYLTYNGQKIKLESKSIDDNTQFFINDNEVEIGGESNALWIDAQMLDDVIVVSVTGTDIRTTRLFAFSQDGQRLLEIYAIDPTLPGMVIGYSLDEEVDIIVSGNTLILQGSRSSHGPTIVTQEGENIGLDLNDPTLSNDMVVNAQYEVKYQGNGVFGEIKKTQDIATVSDYRARFGE